MVRHEDKRSDPTIMGMSQNIGRLRLFYELVILIELSNSSKTTRGVKLRASSFWLPVSLASDRVYRPRPSFR